MGKYQSISRSYRAEVRVAGGWSCHLDRHRSSIGLDHRGSGVADGRSGMGVAVVRSRVSIIKESRSSSGHSQQRGKDLAR